MRDKPATPAATLLRARAIARANGVRYVYTGNVHDRAGGETSYQGVKGKVAGAETRRPTIVALKGPLQHRPP